MPIELGARLLCLILIWTVTALAERLPIKTYTTADGLAQDHVNCIVRDRRGFLRDLRHRQPRLRERPAPLPVVLAAGEPAGDPPPGTHLAVAVAGGGARTVWTHRTDVLDAADVARMQRQLRTFLSDLAAHPDRPLADLAILDPEERHRLLVEWNATEVVYERGGCVHEAVEAQVERTPEAEALVVGERRLSYRELDGEANRLARRLRGLGVGRGSRVGVYLDRSVEMVVGLLGILKSGAAYVPMDPEFPSRRLGFMVEDAGVEVVVSRRGLAGELPGGVRVVEVDGREVLDQGGRQEDDLAPLTPRREPGGMGEKRSRT